VTDLPVSVYVSSQAGDRRIAKNCRWAVDFLVGKKVPHAVVDLAVQPEMRSRLEALCVAAGSPLAGVKGLTPLTGGDEHERGLPMVDIRGQRTITHYEMLEAFGSAALLEIVLETGRTHQIRVHFSAFRHPLIGDTMYGADPKLAAKLCIERQWLHAMRLSFEHPITGIEVSFSSEYPEELAVVLERLRNQH
jgi:23S rRNA pseudouridine1911/1915/1917 synthase